MKRRKEALAAFEQASREHPDDLWPLYAQGYLLLKLRCKRQARGRCQTTLALCDQKIMQYAHDTAPLTLKGHTLRLLHRYVEALACYDQALLLDPSLENHASRIASLWGLHRYREFWRAWKRSLHRHN